MRSSTYPDEISDSWTYFGHWAAHHDRATLLDLAERQSEENEKLRAEIWRLRADNERLTRERDESRAEVARLRTVYVLIASRKAGPIDSATCWYEDKIIGCYISREVAEGVAKLLMADWRIEEYALEIKL